MSEYNQPAPGLRRPSSILNAARPDPVPNQGQPNQEDMLAMLMMMMMAGGQAAAPMAAPVPQGAPLADAMTAGATVDPQMMGDMNGYPEY